MRILIIEDDDALRTALRRSFAAVGYEVVVSSDGEEGLRQAQTMVPDAIVLDLGLPRIDGMDVCRQLRRSGNHVPILMLSGRDAVEDLVAGLEAGADDYLVKPFDTRELQARVRTIMRRHGAGAGGHSLRFGNLTLDADAHAAHIGDRTVELTRTEYLLLELFMLHPRQVLPSALIHDRVWGSDDGAGNDLLRAYVGYLRRKLEAGGAHRLIQTVHGIGYVLREPKRPAKRPIQPEQTVSSPTVPPRRAARR